MSPNDRLYNFDYANNFVLNECYKRNITVALNTELLKVEEEADGMKLATIRETDTG